MFIAIAGAGPVAQALGYVLSRRGWRVRAVASRSPRRAEEAARFIGGPVEPLDYLALGRLAMPTIIAVTDRAIPEVARIVASAAVTPSIAVHTCGAAGPGILAPLVERGWACGVLHPLQTIPSGTAGARDIIGATFGTGGDDQARAFADALAGAMDGRVLHVRTDSFALYHAAAVLAGNGMFALVDAAASMLARAGVEPDAALAALGPLCEASLANALSGGTDARLTGPVARGDVSTVAAHLSAISSQSPDTRPLYLATAVRLLGVARGQGLAPDAQAALARALDTSH